MCLGLKKKKKNQPTSDIKKREGEKKALSFPQMQCLCGCVPGCLHFPSRLKDYQKNTVLPVPVASRASLYHKDNPRENAKSKHWAYRVLFSQGTHTYFSQVSQQVKLIQLHTARIKKDHEKLGSFYQTFYGGKKKNKCQGQAVERFWTQSHYLCSLFFLGMCSFVFWRGKPRPMRREVKKRCEDGLLGSFSHETARSCGHILTPSLWKKAYNAFTVFFAFGLKAYSCFEG